MKTIEMYVNSRDVDTAKLLDYFGFKIHGLSKYHQEIELPNGWDSYDFGDEIYVTDSLHRLRACVYNTNFKFLSRYYVYSAHNTGIVMDVLNGSVLDRIFVWKCIDLDDAYKKMFEKCPSYHGDWFERCISYWDEEIDFND